MPLLNIKYPPIDIIQEVQIVYRLFLVSCYLLHVPRLPSQPASTEKDLRGWVIEKNWLELAWQYIAVTRNNLYIIWIALLPQLTTATTSITIFILWAIKIWFALCIWGYCDGTVCTDKVVFAITFSTGCVTGSLRLTGTIVRT